MRFQLLFKQKCIGHPKLSHIKRLSEVLKPNKNWKFLTKFDIWRDHGLWVVTKSYSPKLGEQLGGRLSPGMLLIMSAWRARAGGATDERGRSVAGNGVAGDGHMAAKWFSQGRARSRVRVGRLRLRLHFRFHGGSVKIWRLFGYFRLYYTVLKRPLAWSKSANSSHISWVELWQPYDR